MAPRRAFRDEQDCIHEQNGVVNLRWQGDHRNVAEIVIFIEHGAKDSTFVLIT